MKIGIMGAGSLGCFLGSRLLLKGNEVLFVGRGSVQDEINKYGLTIIDYHGGKEKIPANLINFQTQASVLGSCNIIFLCVKSIDTIAAGKILSKVLQPGTFIVNFQNGVQSTGQLRDLLPGLTISPGIISFNVLRQGRAIFQQGTSGPILLEKNELQRLDMVANALRAAGFQAIINAQFERVIWSKLLFNLNNAINALSGLPLREQLLDRNFRRALKLAMQEALQLLREAGIKPVRLGRLNIHLALPGLALPDFLFKRLASSMLSMNATARSSMWDDLERKRPTEIDYLNGEVVELARQLQKAAPVNARIVELVKEAEGKKQGSPRLNSQQLLLALGF